MLRRSIAIVFIAVLSAFLVACTNSNTVAGDGFTLQADQLISTTTTAPKPTHTTTVATANVPVLVVFEEIPNDDCIAFTTDTTTSSEEMAVPWLSPDASCLDGSNSEPTTDTTVAHENAGAHASESPPTTAGSADESATTTVTTHAPIPRPDLNSAASARTAFGWTFDNPTYFENPLVMIVTEQEGDWIKVMIAARPKETQGWVRASDVTLSDHRFHLKLTLSNFTLQAWDGDDLLAETLAVIGTDHTRTPTGNFYISEKIQQSYTGGAYGPWILSTNGYSEDLDFFDGGLPVIALHGTNQPALVGSKASNGCIRIPNEVIEKLAAVLPAGTPIEIVA